MNPQDSETQEVVSVPTPESRAITKFTAEHGLEVGLPSPEAINFMMSVAKLVSQSALVTKDMGVGPDQIRSNALAKMLIGNEMGMKPMESLQEIDIVKGKIFLRYPTLLNEIIKRGFKWRWMERSGTRAAMQITRPGEEPETFEYTLEDARMAGMLYPDSQYFKRPRVMLSARVISEVYRNTGGRSNVYTPEERAEIFADEPSDPESQAAPEKVTEFKVGRKSAKTQAPAEVFSEPQPEKEGVPSQRAESPSESVPAPDKPPFDPTPESEQPMLNTVPKPDPAKPSASTSTATVQRIPQAKVQDYLRGFLDVTKVPKAHANMDAALEYLASLDPLIVLRDPYALGVDLRDYMNGAPLWAERMSPADLRAFLRVLARGGFKLATKFRESAMEDGQPSKIVAEWEESGMDMSTCTADDIESALTVAMPESRSLDEALAAAHDENPFAKLRGK